MKRRTVLATAAAIASGFAGCVSGDGAGNDDDGDAPSSPTETPSETASKTPSETASKTPSETPSISGAVIEATFDIVKSECGTGTEEASVDQGTGHVTVEGTISGRNACYTARLERAAYDTAAGELTVAVQSFEKETEETEMCAQCIVDFDYRARISYDATAPETVTVLHDGKRISLDS